MVIILSPPPRVPLLAQAQCSACHSHNADSGTAVQAMTEGTLVAQVEDHAAHDAVAGCASRPVMGRRGEHDGVIEG